MSGLDTMLPPDSASVLTVAARFMTEEIAPGALARDGAGDLTTAELQALAELGLPDVLTTEELGTVEQRLALLLALGGVLAETDAGMGMALLTRALTEQATGVCAGFGVTIGRPSGPGVVLLAAGQPTVVIVDEEGRGHRAPLERTGACLLGLRLGGAQLLDPPPTAGDALSPDTLAGLRRDLARAALAVAVGTARGSAKTAVEYAKERYQGGGMIVRHHAVVQMLDAMTSRLAHAEVLLAALLADPDAPTRRDLVLRGLQACEAVVSDGVQVLGGYGYMQEYGQEKRMRDTRTLRLLFGPH